MIKFYYQVAVTMKPINIELHVDGDVSGKNTAECIALIHKTGKEQLVKVARLADPQRHIDMGAIQTKMTMLVQVFEQPAVKVVPCA